MEACYDQIKQLESESQRLAFENRTLNGKIASMELLKNEMNDQLNDRNKVTQDLTETIDELVTNIIL